MGISNIILNEREVREARGRIARLSEALQSERALDSVVAGLPPEVTAQVTRMMRGERERLEAAVGAYEQAKDTGRASDLGILAGRDPGLTLIVARIAKGYSQRDLAWRLGLKEQQIQRYEAERYSQISLKNYGRLASLLGVCLSADIQEKPEFRGLDRVIEDVSKADIRKILKHGRERSWFSDEMTEAELRRYVAENRIDFGSPHLLRTGLNVVDHSEDVLLHAWRARVSHRAREAFGNLGGDHDPINIGWLPGLVRLSQLDDGPRQAERLLSKQGIVLVAEPQIPGLAIDGAAFIVEGRPVIGMTIRKDTIDNFWFTLLHEVGHVTLHYSTGLATGFYDQMEAESVDEQEAEADSFASNILIPEEIWRRSTARIAKSESVIEKFAGELGIHPAIVFGRIRKERNNYALFNKKIGGNTVRKLLMGDAQEGVYNAPLLPSAPSKTR